MSEMRGQADIHPVGYLFERLQDVAPYPPGVVPVPARIQGSAFFPGGTGLWQSGPDLPAMPTKGVMILGHNFDTLVGFERSRTHSGENLRGATWRNLLFVLDEVGIPRERCFFTNVYMGLIDGRSAVGRFPGAKDASFVTRCISLLGEQIQLVQPKLILTLGKEVIPLIARLSPNLHNWRGVRSLRKLDQQTSPLAHPVIFAGVSHAVTVAALTHPAFRLANLRWREYRGMHGEDAERALLSDAVNKAQIYQGEAMHVRSQA